MSEINLATATVAELETLLQEINADRDALRVQAKQVTQLLDLKRKARPTEDATEVDNV